MRLVADMGGSNSRVGLATKGRVLPASVRLYDNDAFAGPEEVLERYQADTGHDAPASLVIAIAGPVTGAQAKITNRDWTFDAPAFSARHEGVPVRLINDLTALGYALPDLAENDFQTLLAGGDEIGPELRQSLVINIGTGFNVAPVFEGHQGNFCALSEYGHSHLSQHLMQAAEKTIGTGDFPTVEDLFSGRGYARAKGLWEPGSEITFDRAYARLIGHLAQDLLLTFLPFSGLWFSGGVARAVLSSHAKSGFFDTFIPPPPLSPSLRVPVHVILDDSATLGGCARVAIG